MNNSLNDLVEKFNSIEQLAEVDLDTALCQMIDLFEGAAGSYYHDIVDSIIIWITTKGNINTLEYLKVKINSTEDEYSKEIFKEWISILERN